MTSSVRIFAKSLHWLALGWAVGVVWLCYSQIRHGLLFDPVVDYHVDTLIAGGIPALLIEVCAFFSIAIIGGAPTRDVEWREWFYSFLWALFPIVMVLYTVYLMVIGEI
jgi:uncharacterized membrane protein